MLSLELNDALLTLATDQADAPLIVAPGVACVAEEGILTGEAAAHRAKLQPLRSYLRYWHELAAVPLGRAHQPQLTAADLAFDQLRALFAAAGGAPDRLLIAAPPLLAREQLGLLLGIAAEAGAGEVGLVDAGLAACALAPVPAHVLHLELYRHAAIVTTIEQTTDGARRGRVEANPDCGTQRIEQRVIDAVAAQFVRKTRFDPLHNARSEQSLADGVWSWLQDLGTAESVDISLQVAEAALQIQWTRTAWQEVGEPLCKTLLQLVQAARPAGQAVELRLGSVAQRLPGLADRLRGLSSCEVSLLPPGAAARGALLQHPQILRGAHPALVCQLPLAVREAVAEAAVPASERSGVAATHILHAARAWPLAGQPLAIGTQLPAGERGLQLPGGVPGVSRLHCRVSTINGNVSVEDLSTYGTFVNDERVHGRATLWCGDVLRLGTPGIPLQLIQLVDEHEDAPAL